MWDVVTGPVTGRRLAVDAAIAVPVTAVGVWVWTVRGGGLPAPDGLKAGITRGQVVARLGPPSAEGERPDGTRWMRFTRPGSFVWVELEFDARGRLSAFGYERF